METDTPSVFDDEVIADSEEETEQSEVKNHGQDDAGYGNFEKESSVSAFTTAGYPQHRPFSTISTFSGDASIPVNKSPHNSSIEPGTSPKTRNKNADTSMTSMTNTFLDFEGISGTASIADRAKMRQRSQKKTATYVSDIIELTSDDDDELSLKPTSSKATKSKVKTKPIPKEKAAPPAITTTSGNVKAVPAATSKSRPRPRPIPKRPRYGEEGMTSASTPSHDPELPIATSPPPPLGQQIRKATPANARPQIISQLPPSDPPDPSSTMDYNEQHTFEVPVIETLHPNVAPSSPNSLFSETGGKRKSKRSLDTDAEIDELASDVPYNNPIYGDDDISLGKRPPPGTFFAGSSSSSIGGGKGDEIPATPVPEREVVDLTMLPATMAPTVKKAQPKLKKSKKKKNDDVYDDSTSAPGIILDEDDLDDDFDPTADGSAKKKKGKAKAIDKRTKSKAKAKMVDPVTSPGSGSGQVEVVITSKPPRSKSKAKEGGSVEDKRKDTKSAKEGNKEGFKSSEFIDDSGDDDPMRLVELPAPSAAPITPAVPSTTTTTNLPSTAPLKIRLPAASTSPRIDLPIPDSDSEMKTVASKSKSTASGKKRKTIVDSDEEDDYKDDVQIVVKPAPPKSKKRKVDNVDKNKPKLKKKERAKQVISSDAEEEVEKQDVHIPEEPEVQIKAKTSKKERSSKKMVVDEEDNPFQGGASDDAPPQKSTPEEVAQATKENAAPTVSKPSSAMVTPRPQKPVPVNRDGTMPLYSRYEIAPRRSSLPMSELIRRANSMPGSPFSTPHPTSASASKVKSLIARTPTSTAYSPYLKSSRSLLSKIAPLHPNRRTPPPPPPPPPPRKKSKKELEMEEKWEEEMVEEVGGMEEWAALTDSERREMRKMKWARELGGWDE